MRGQQRRSMTIHRTRARRPEKDREAHFDPAVTITLVQVIFCMILVVCVFTMQFFDREKFDRVGDYYKAVMGGDPGEAVFVGNFGEPIDFDKLQEYFDSTAIQRNPFLGSEDGMGGESPYIPSNVYYGPVLFTATARYPAYGAVTSEFGLRTHPITGREDFHTGIDVAAPQGESIYAVYPGTVEEVGQSNIYGNYIKVRHSPRLATVYSHCSAILAAEGSVVRGGERIAEVGSTGVSTGPHVHLDLLVDGCYVDPMELYPQ